ncbi:hypothetical protein [Acetobacter sp. UBA5411]|uniref:hypothetical protein n=1 Tax=Acetobacter sp. UBA5411 TaxID=1945905 RepID=UPI0025BB2811|nr:hypothetical protein [Acetobacter sp. UBA5411]
MTERQDPFSPPPETPETFVIRTPLTEAQETALTDWIMRVGRGDNVTFIDLLRAVGVRAQSSALVIGYACPRDFYPEKKLVGASITFNPYYDYFPIIRESDHLAVLAEKDAEAQRLREALLSIETYGSDTLSGQAKTTMSEQSWLKIGVKELRDRARKALKGAAS